MARRPPAGGFRAKEPGRRRAPAEDAYQRADFDGGFDPAAAIGRQSSQSQSPSQSLLQPRLQLPSQSLLRLLLQLLPQLSQQLLLQLSLQLSQQLLQQLLLQLSQQLLQPQFQSIVTCAQQQPLLHGHDGHTPGRQAQAGGQGPV